MLFRTNTGQLVDIKKYDFPNDKIYYEKIISIKKQLTSSYKFPKLVEKSFDCKNK